MAPKLNENGIPSFDDLPLREGDPHHSAWGLYGPRDELGTLNRLTDARVAAAARGEIRTGARVSLNWPLDAQGAESGYFQRRLFHQEMFQRAPRLVNDDVWAFNSQVSSQWDGFRHYGYQEEGRFYNGVTLEEIYATDAGGRKSTVNGIQGVCVSLCIPFPTRTETGYPDVLGLTDGIWSTQPSPSRASSVAAS